MIETEKIEWLIVIMLMLSISSNLILQLISGLLRVSREFLVVFSRKNSQLSSKYDLIVVCIRLPKLCHHVVVLFPICAIHAFHAMHQGIFYDLTRHHVVTMVWPNLADTFYTISLLWWLLPVLSLQFSILAPFSSKISLTLQKRNINKLIIIYRK